MRNASDGRFEHPKECAAGGWWYAREDSNLWPLALEFAFQARTVETRKQGMCSKPVFIASSALFEHDFEHEFEP